MQCVKNLPKHPSIIKCPSCEKNGRLVVHYLAKVARGKNESPVNMRFFGGIQLVYDHISHDQSPDDESGIQQGQGIDQTSGQRGEEGAPRGVKM